jgi:hypothetical protein
VDYTTADGVVSRTSKPSQCIGAVPHACFALQLAHLDAFFPGAAGPSSSAAAAAAARQTADMVAEFERHQQVRSSRGLGHIRTHDTPFPQQWHARCL